jgi:hypothetical protein
MSFWNEEQRAKSKAHEGHQQGDLWIPWAQKCGIRAWDYIYIVGITEGDLLLVSRVVAASVRALESDDERVEIRASDDVDSIDIRFDRIVDRASADSIIYRMSNATTEHFRRDDQGMPSRARPASGSLCWAGTT